jgi:hypothetical protein
MPCSISSYGASFTYIDILPRLESGSINPFPENLEIMAKMLSVLASVKFKLIRLPVYLLDHAAIGVNMIRLTHKIQINFFRQYRHVFVLITAVETGVSYLSDNLHWFY